MLALFLAKYPYVCSCGCFGLIILCFFQRSICDLCTHIPRTLLPSNAQITKLRLLALELVWRSIPHNTPTSAQVNFFLPYY
ncbi:hypothetical protein GQ44DRAFT_460080 [Phaeosphaeriaceae sp. PMI808]|nr:hypothetical protein GQ44DRAFT_460080 [Phaeosphaeriaceae sp. PMI808]